jgi:hypothetical protein
MNAGWISFIAAPFGGKKAAKFQHIAAVEDRLFTAAVMHEIRWEDLGRVQIVSNDAHLRASLADVLLDQRVEICFSHDLSGLENSNVVLMDIDSLGGIVRLIDQLLILRAQNRNLIIILLSAEFSRDDFDTDRLAICDALLRLPFSFARLEQAFVEADKNNMVWQDQRVRPTLSRCTQPSQAIAK